MRIKDAWQAYHGAKVRRPDSGPATLCQYESHWTRFESWITATHADAEHLRDVTPEMAEEYAGDLLEARLSDGRFNKHIRFLDLCFRVLAKPGKITVNPWKNPKRNDGKGIPRREQQEHSRRELTIPELTSILDHADGDLACLLLLGAATGLRLGDCCTLTWGDVDLARRIIRRIPNKTARKGKGEPVVLGIPPLLHERLAAIPVKSRTGYVLPDMAERYRRDVALVTNAVKANVLDCGIDVHAPETGSRIKREAEGTPERDGNGKVITVPTGRPAVVEVGFHSLRHTWVSMHAAAGTPGAVIQASVGHANPAMTAHYTHVQDDTARSVALALPVFAGNGDGPARESLPAWAIEALEGMNARNWKAVRSEMLKGGAR